MTFDPAGEPVHLTPELRRQLPRDVDPERLEAFLAHSPAEDRPFYLQLALGPRPPTEPPPVGAPPAPERVAYIERVDAPRGLSFSDEARQAAWRAVFRRAVD